MIDGYLDTMRGEIRWRRDLDDVVAEMEDHLYSAVETFLARGLEPLPAQQATLDRFGEPRVLATVYASTPTGGIAVPTQSSIRAGLFGLVAAGFWALAAVAYVLMAAREESWQGYYAAFSVSVLVAGVLTTLTLFGIKTRHGGLGVVGSIAVWLYVVGVVFSVVAWAIPLWMGVQGIALLAVAIRVYGSNQAPRLATVLSGGGMLVGVASFIILSTAEIGWRDSYGDYPLAWAIGTVIGVVLLALGLVMWGLWLRSEEPTDIEAPSSPVAA
jgi:hypothetical protein